MANGAPDVTFAVYPGVQGRSMLMASGLLSKAPKNLSMRPMELLAMAQSPDAFTMIASQDDEPVGYLVGRIFDVVGEGLHMFIGQVWSGSSTILSYKAQEAVEQLAHGIGCRTIAMTVPIQMADRFAKVYGFVPRGTYMTKYVGPVEA